MAKFTPRTTAPKKTDRHYYSNENPYFATGYGMPNCPAYAWGRLYEITDKRPDKLVGQPEDWYATAQKIGMKVGQVPKLGAIAVWKKGQVKNSKDGTGHVNVVEKIYDNGDFESSNSQYKGKEFYMQRITKASGYQYAGGFDFLGFIYCGIEFETESSTTPTSSTSSASSDVVIKAGTKFNLKDINVYTSEKGSAVGKRTGTYYAWEDAKSTTSRIRMTNSPSRVGVANQISFLVEVKDLVIVTTTTNTTAPVVVPTPTKTLNEKSYPDYTIGKSYHVKKSFKDWITSKGTYRIWKNAFNQWKKYKDKGYHIYDTNGKQLD